MTRTTDRQSYEGFPDPRPPDPIQAEERWYCPERGCRRNEKGYTDYFVTPEGIAKHQRSHWGGRWGRALRDIVRWWWLAAIAGAVILVLSGVLSEDEPSASNDNPAAAYPNYEAFQYYIDYSEDQAEQSELECYRAGFTDCRYEPFFP